MRGVRFTVRFTVLNCPVLSGGCVRSCPVFFKKPDGQVKPAPLKTHAGGKL
jgi:hypothetical protein